jgi:hypothetical protein
MAQIAGFTVSQKRTFLKQPIISAPQGQEDHLYSKIQSGEHQEAGQPLGLVARIRTWGHKNSSVTSSRTS